MESIGLTGSPPPELSEQRTSGMPSDRQFGPALGIIVADREQMPIAGTNVDTEPVPNHSRRSMVSAAVSGLQRFKQSWLSIMILKAGIGLSQVVVLITLLALAQVLPSPLTHRSQIENSSSCPRPGLFQAWIGTSIGRLVLCWSASCWMCVRQRRVETSHNDEEAVQMEGNVVSGAPDRLVGHQPPTPRNTPQPTTGSSLSTLVEPSTPSLIHSTSLSTGSSSSATLAQISSMNSSGTSSDLTAVTVPSTPDTIYTSHIGLGGSSYSLNGVMSSPVMSMENKPPHRHGQFDVDDGTDAGEELEMYDLFEGFGRKPRRKTPVPELDQQTETMSGPHDPRVSNTFPRPCTPNTQHSLQAARDLVTGRSSRASSRASSRSIATLLDTLAPLMSKAMGLLSAMLFVLGNVLLFSPLPSKQDTCYHSAPLLWWGVMTVIGVGWFLLLQVFCVVLIVGVGGQAVLAALRSSGLIPSTVPQTSSRDPPSAVLTMSELDKIAKVVYVPASSQDPTAGSHSEVLVATYGKDRLPFPPLALTEAKSTCAICQESYTPPREVKAIMLQSDILRLLPCGHSYHANCIDQWLSEGSGNCPFCNRPARSSENSKVMSRSSVVRR